MQPSHLLIKDQQYILYNTLMYNYMIDFNGMSTCLGLFYAERLENPIHCTFYLYFLGSFFKSILLHGPIEYK